MATDVILVLITLATTVVGTIFNPKPRIKACIITLAVALGTATLVKAYQDSEDRNFIRTALAAQLASSKPTPEFDRALEKSLEEVSTMHGLHASGNEERDEDGTVYFFSKAESNARSGAITLDLEDKGTAFVQYVATHRLNAFVERAMFKVSDLKNEDQTQKLLNSMVILGIFVMKSKLAWANGDPNLSTSIGTDPISIRITLSKGSNKATVTLNKEFIDAVAGLPPVDRDWKVYQEFERQVTKQI